MKVNQDEFLRAFSKHGYTLKDSRIIFEDFKQTIYDILREGNDIRLCSFLDFDLLWRDSGYVIDPRSGTSVENKPHYLLKIKCGKQMKSVLAEASQAHMDKQNAEE